jgi:hypothetical protein
VLEITDEIRELILIGASALELRKKAIDDGMITLRESGLHKIRERRDHGRRSCSRNGRLIRRNPNMLRTIAISLVLLLSVGIMLPFANSAHGIRQSTQLTQKKSKRYRSRAWWRRYRARMRARRAAEELARP